MQCEICGRKATKQIVVSGTSVKCCKQCSRELVAHLPKHLEVVHQSQSGEYPSLLATEPFAPQTGDMGTAFWIEETPDGKYYMVEQAVEYSDGDWCEVGDDPISTEIDSDHAHAELDSCKYCDTPGEIGPIHGGHVLGYADPDPSDHDYRHADQEE